VLDPLFVPGSHGGATCPGVLPACASLCTRPELVPLLRAEVPSCVVLDPLRLVVLLPLLLELLWLLVDVEPLPDVRPEVEPPLEVVVLPEFVLLPVLDDAFTGVHGT